MRIILRTGEPGQAPERQVIVDYDINDYKAKTELTADKLFTALTAALQPPAAPQHDRDAARSRDHHRRDDADAVRFPFDAKVSPKACSRRYRRCWPSTARAF